MDNNFAIWNILVPLSKLYVLLVFTILCIEKIYPN